MSLSPSFKDKKSAEKAGYVFLPSKNTRIERVYKKVYRVINGRKSARSYEMGRIIVADVTPGASFGYKFALRAMARSRPGVDMVAIGNDFGATEEVYIENARNAGGGQGAYYTNVMKKRAYKRALHLAKKAIDDYPVYHDDN